MPQTRMLSVGVPAIQTYPPPHWHFVGRAAAPLVLRICFRDTSTVDRRLLEIAAALVQRIAGPCFGHGLALSTKETRHEPCYYAAQFGSPQSPHPQVTPARVALLASRRDEPQWRGSSCTDRDRV